MARYQLYRTSSALSGQVRLDIILNKDPNSQEIYGDDIYIAPINDKIKFNESEKRNTLRYSHLDNIKNLYREIGSEFYNTEGEYVKESWLYFSDTPVDPYSHTYMTGPKRLRFSRYNKQFSYMVPLWISEPTDISKLKFICHVSSENRDNILSSFKLNEDICKYLQEYINHSADGNPISENLLSIDFENLESHIQGVQANTGQYMLIDTSYILDFLLKRQRPMMETDSIILDLFKQNNIIAQQLLNLNFVFNIQDISGAWPEYYLYNKKINFWIEVQYDNKLLEYKDLYTNYQFIPKYDLNSNAYTTKNVLDYMQDYDCIDLVSSNKFTQPIFHWSLINNPDCLFNLYSGCAPYIGNNIIMDGGNFNWVDISLDHSDPWKQNWKWIKYSDRMGVNYWINEFDANENDPELLYTEFKIKNEFLNIGNNIFRTYYDDEDRFAWKNIFPANLNKEIWLALVRGNILEEKSYDFHIKTTDDKILVTIICEDIDNMVLYKICHNKVNDENVFWQDLQSYLIGAEITENDKENINLIFSYIIGINDKSDKNLYDRWIKPNKIEFNQSLSRYYKDQTILSQIVKEFEYTETRKSFYSYLYRYSGSMNPMFIDPHDKILNNEFYRYFQWNDGQLNIIRNYSILKKHHIPMKHPSIIVGEADGFDIAYFPWIKDGKYDGSDFYKNWNKDVFWERNNMVWNLPYKVMFNIEALNSDSTEVIKDKIWSGFIQKLREISIEEDCPLADILEEYPDDMKPYIYDNYEVTQNFEYKSITNIKDIIYTVTFKLR